MLLPKTGRYALMATLEIARRSGGDAGAPTGAVRAAELAEALDVPANYLAKILHRLAQAGVLSSERGPAGGFRLSAPAAELSLEAVLDPVVSGLYESQCLLGLPECRDDAPCAVHEHWRAVTDEMKRFLRHTSLADLLDRGTGAGRRGRKRRGR